MPRGPHGAGGTAAGWERVGPWRVRLAPDAPREPLLAVIGAVGGPGAADPAAAVKQSRVRRVLRIPLADGSVAFVKHAGRLGAARRWPGFGSRSRALEEFENLERIRALGVAVVEPLACAERGERGTIEETLLVTRELPGARSLARALDEADDAGRARLVADLASGIRSLHDAGLWHRDLHRGNVLVGRPAGAERDRPVLVDLQKLRALPFPVPGWLRARDLAMLEPGDGRLAGLLDRYAAAGPSTSLAPLVRRVARAEVRRRRARLRSRGRRCIQASSGFRVERFGEERLYRRADIEPAAVRGALEDHRKTARGERSGIRFSRVEGVLGGPPGGPAPDPFARGQGRSEPGAPVRAALAVHEFDEGLAARLAGLALRRRGMSGWRRAHAALLRGVETPAPLALLEERRHGRVVRSFLLARWEDRAETLRHVLAGAGRPEALLREVGRFLARLHRAGLSHRRLGVERLLVQKHRDRPEEPSCTLFVSDPWDLHVGSRTSRWRRRRDRRALAAGIAAATGLAQAEIERRLRDYAAEASSASTSR